jgi:hypothetical protein
MKRPTGIFGLLLLLLLTICASYQWSKPGVTQQEFSQDAYACERDARQGGYYEPGGLELQTSKRFKNDADFSDL